MKVWLISNLEILMMCMASYSIISIMLQGNNKVSQFKNKAKSSMLSFGTQYTRKFNYTNEFKA